jgi:hypothetical protein
MQEKLKREDSLAHLAGTKINPDPVKTNPLTTAINNYSTTPVDMAWFMYKSLNDTSVYKRFLLEAGNHFDVEIIYRVQIGAYRHPENFKYPQMSPYGNAYINPLSDGITRFTYKVFKTVGEAETFRQECIHKGFADAWITAEYQGKRMTLEELIANKVYEKISG